VRRYLVVANQTLGGDELVQAVRERMLHEPSEFWVLVPATEPRDYAEGGLGAGYTSMSGVNLYGAVPVGRVRRTDMASSGVSTAQQRLDEELQRLHTAGADADGEVGDADPVKAISKTLARRQFDEIILSTLPRARSRWLRQDLPNQIRKKFQLPVTHVVSTEPR
jgi:hypothetical protein